MTNADPRVVFREPREMFLNGAAPPNKALKAAGRCVPAANARTLDGLQHNGR